MAEQQQTLNLLVWQIPALVFGGLFVVRLIAAPYWMHEEDEVKRQAGKAEEERKRAELEDKLGAEQAQHKALLDDRRKREEQMECLAGLLEEGSRLKNEKVTRPDIWNEWNRDFEEWVQRVQSEMEQKFSPAMAKRLLSLDPIIDKNAGSHNIPHRDALGRISAIHAGMHAMFRSLEERN